ncbi:FMN-binding protein [Desulfonatronovibrio hydrogenovorans]|uniref:FMN-binding protein n=1 Tax=Desulfonatronovibrio hydrogenovorans TaxID=53245 RepID=UPI00068B4A30|nr:FMN-binding protein [Desulfonatronovibrio hydrogenovorans]
MKKLILLILSTALVFTVANVSAAETNYENGTYRGIFADRGDIQVAIQLTLENNMVTDISFRQLYHSGIDYRTSKRYSTVNGIRDQHQQLINYLLGKDIRISLADLYHPGSIVTTEIDGFTGATLRSGKIISAINDALNRGVYRY